MHYGLAEILEKAVRLDDVYKQASITLFEGDTAYAPGTTKKVLAGYGRITYLISAMSNEVTEMDATIRVRYI
jgi:hypothetical protein